MSQDTTNTTPLELPPEAFPCLSITFSLSGKLDIKFPENADKIIDHDTAEDILKDFEKCMKHAYNQWLISCRLLNEQGIYKNKFRDLEITDVDINGDVPLSPEEIKSLIDNTWSLNEEDDPIGRTRCLHCSTLFNIGEDGNDLGFCSKCVESEDFPFDLDAFYAAYDRNEVEHYGTSTLCEGILEQFRK